MYDDELKNKIKTSLRIEDVFQLVAELGGEPVMRGEDSFVSKTICHNLLGEGSHKLYYYDNTKLFRCYTECGDSFDIYELVCRVKNTRKDDLIPTYSNSTFGSRKWELPDGLKFVSSYFGFDLNAYQPEERDSLSDYWKTLSRYDKIEESNSKSDQVVNLKFYKDDIFKHFPRPRILPWEQEGITKEIIKDRKIAYDPCGHNILIPHYDIDNNLVGIRSRTLCKDKEKIIGKYRPSILNQTMYSHPLGFNLYNLNNSKENIKSFKTAIVFEGEKSCLKYASFFGKDCDISVATCGSSLSSYQIDLLKELGVQEIVIGFDKQFKEEGDAEWQRWTKMLRKISEKNSSYIKITYLFDSQSKYLEYKDSPIDKGPEVFMELFKSRFTIEREENEIHFIR